VAAGVIQQFKLSKTEEKNTSAISWTNRHFLSFDLRFYSEVSVLAFFSILNFSFSYNLKSWLTCGVVLFLLFWHHLV